MGREEGEDESARCADCGAAIDAGADPGFPFGERSVLCFECAIRRGGEYDAPGQQWTASPDLTALEEEAAEA